jgi:hypothetical protein
MVRSLMLMPGQSVNLVHLAPGPPLKLHGGHERIAEVEAGINVSEGNNRVTVEHYHCATGNQVLEFANIAWPLISVKQELR